MIKASDLVSARVATVDTILKNIEANILTAERGGHRNYCWWPKSNDPTQAIVAELVNHGFGAEVKRDNDPRDGDLEYVEITWA